MKRVLIENTSDIESEISSLCPDKAEECKQLLIFISLLSSLRLPVTIIKCERPDFIIEFGSQKLGVEVTWSCDEGWEAAEKYLGSSKNSDSQKISRSWFVGNKHRGKVLGAYLRNKQGDRSVSWHPRELAAAWVEQVLEPSRGRLPLSIVVT
jgi:hypothetical protein